MKASLRVIADHLRASSFLIADGVLPSNEGRVAMCCAGSCAARCVTASCSAAREPLMWRLVWALVREMGQAYPELVRAEKLIEETLRLEEMRFRKTLDRGLIILDEKSGVAEERATCSTVRPRSRCTTPMAFRSISHRMHCARAACRSIVACVHGRRWRSRRPKRANPGKVRAMPRPKRSGIRCAKNWAATEFLGYETETAEGVVAALITDGQGSRRRLAKGDSGAIVMNQTPFYAESGGQVGDTGMLHGEGVTFRVTETQKKGRRSVRASRHRGAGRS